MKKLTSRTETRRAIENGSINIGTWITTTEGIFEVTWVDSEYEIPVEVREVIFDDEDFDKYSLGDEHRWTVSDLIGAEI